MGFYKDKVVLITGSARGIGLAAARLMGGRGARVIISDIIEDVLESARSELEAAGVEVLAVKADVTSPGDCEALVAAAAERFGRLDILINNAGISIVDYLENLRPETAKKIVDVNIMGCVYMTIAALPELKKTRGQVAFVSSVSGIRNIPTACMYGSTKAFLRSFAESIRLELKPMGIHVSVISPGFATTDPNKTVMRGDGSARPIDRPPHSTPEDVAREMAQMIERKERERVTTPLGKATLALERLSPTLLDWILAGRELKN